MSDKVTELYGDAAPDSGGHGSSVSMEKTVQFSGLLQKGPIEFFYGAEVSPSLRALRYAHNEEHMGFIDLVLAVYYRNVARKAPENEQPHELLVDVISDSSPQSLLWAEAHSMLAVCRADQDDLKNAMAHFQSAVDAYQLLGRADALSVSFARHSKAMYEQGEFRAANRSLMQAEFYVASVDRPIYRDFCQLIRLEGMYLQGRIAQAAAGAGAVQLHKGMGGVFQSRLLALQYAGLVACDASAEAEAMWNKLNNPEQENSPCAVIAIESRVRFLLNRKDFVRAAETVLHFLQLAPLLPNRCKRYLLDMLMQSEAIKQLPPFMSYYFDSLLLSVDIETKAARTFDIDLNFEPRDGF